MKSRLQLVVAVLICPAIAFAQNPPQRPAPVVSPEVLPDGRVTFRLRAPQAKEATLRGQWTRQPLVMEKGDVRAVIDVSYQSEPLLGLRVPVAMHERYRARSDRVEGIATYGKFRQFQVRTDEVIEKPDANTPAPPAIKPPPKPPLQSAWFAGSVGMPAPSAAPLRAPREGGISESCRTPSSESRLRSSGIAAP